MGKILFIILLFLSISAKAEVEVHFSPSKECENALVERIGEAEQYIDAAV